MQQNFFNLRETREITQQNITSVSYTHLDVYKRQVNIRLNRTILAKIQI